ncbi:MAG: DNA polymerase/3'-5' exonuclease PolX [Rhodothermaceae bacterium]|nr:DNA polymerase/3'-5' exonuclease PolX [Rhodothermaceae bacterium]
MTNKEIARILKSTSAMIDLTGGNPHRSRAMSNAGRTIERLEERVPDLVASNTLTSIRGIGNGLAAQIKEIIETGTFEAREELLGAIPVGVLDVMRVKGLGAKKVRALWQKLNIISLSELEHAAASGKLATLDGFGEKTAANILQNIQLLKTYSNKRRYADVITFLDPFLDAIRLHEPITAVFYTGDLRRKMETIDWMDIVVVSEASSEVMDILTTVFEPAEPFILTDNRIEGTLSNGLPLRVYLCSPNNAGTVLWQTTGSASHCSSFIDTYGMPGEVSDESSIFELAGLSLIPPELREGTTELDHAKQQTLPTLITNEDLKGTLHNHSTYSDGAHTLKEMADRALSMGLSYFGICDHSRSLVIANGLSIERVANQQEEISQLNAAYKNSSATPFKIFSGIESDILADGSLDYPDEILASFDFIVASVHTRMNMTEDEATERIIKAVENKYTSILGHPTGRILLVREGYPINYTRVLDACAANGVAIELNANPYRLDLDWRWIQEATSRGILISINPDAHALDGLYDTQWGIEVARKGWLSADQCLNAMPLDAFESWLTSH